MKTLLLVGFTLLTSPLTFAQYGEPSDPYAHPGAITVSLVESPVALIIWRESKGELTFVEAKELARREFPKSLKSGQLDVVQSLQTLDQLRAYENSLNN